ncbi:response regulator [Paenibacillus nasutitermitis]|uniref:Response regulator n=1 Tax=Paenibacillus nasutitermitis TaxID=1652958 RepID=A0A916ZFK2_9BACL|nr:response regulator [Paenibacillus nasutitermitis]GGD94976.1 hypothetical protein GCM10010911_62040 [Paenibacillus nasutitermitis]
MRMLIVEDEYYVRDRVAEGIAWHIHQVEVVEAVSNGTEAIAVLLREHIDLIVTDINMPDMSGLELAKYTNEHFPDIKIIILTGYDSFEFAQESIQYNVHKYLIKPATNEELEEAVLEIKDVHEKELIEEHKLSLLQKSWGEHLPYLQQSFYKEWLYGRYSLWEIETKSEKLSIHLDFKYAWPMTIDMDPISETNTRFFNEDRALVQFSLYTLSRDIFQDMDGVVLQNNDGMTIVLLFCVEESELGVWKTKVNTHLEKLLSAVKDTMKLTASVGIGTIVNHNLHVAEAYKHSTMALRERIVLGNDVRIQYRHEVPQQDSWLVFDDLEKQLELAIEIEDLVKMNDIVYRIMELRFNEGVAAFEAKEILLRLINVFIRISHTHGWSMRDLLADKYQLFEEYQLLLSKNQIAEWLQKMAVIISMAISKRRKISTQISKAEIVQYINENLHEDTLSLYELSDRLYVNYSYLSRIFKKIIGESFSEYVLRLRMEKAKELLLAGYLVYDVAQQVGYKHVNYFSKLFAKYWNGIKPSEMKK